MGPDQFMDGRQFDVARLQSLLEGFAVSRLTRLDDESSTDIGDAPRGLTEKAI